MLTSRFAAAAAAVASIVGLSVAVPASAAPATPAAPPSSTLQPAPTTAGASLHDYIRERDARRAATAGDASAQVVYCTTTIWKIWSYDARKYVAVELNYTYFRYNMLRARSAIVGPWEQFILCWDDSGNDYIYSVAAGAYVSMEENYSEPHKGMLRARAGTPGLWERFIINCPSYCYIYSVQNGRYVSVERYYDGADYNMLRARATTVGPFEKFDFQ